MQTSSTRVMTAPTDDKRWRLVTATMRRYGFEADALIETLHTVQEAFGYLDHDALRFVAESLKLPLSKVYGVATFYNFFTLKPHGQHACVVCLGTVCAIKGGPNILSELEALTGINAGETTPDKKVSLFVARCFGACWLAPAVAFDEQVTMEPNLDARIKEWMSDER